MQDGKLKDIVVIFRQGELHYGLNGGRVIEITQISSVTRVPKQPGCLWGIYNYKGTIIPILSMRKLCKQEGFDENPICIIFEVNSKIYGLVVEEILDMKYDTEEKIEFEGSDLDNDNLSVYKVLKLEHVIFVLDIPKMILRIEQQKNE